MHLFKLVAHWIVEMDPKNVGVWKTLFVLSTLIILFILGSLPSLYENISGDGIPNRPQGEPPIVYRWDLATQRIILAFVSMTVGAISLRKIRQLKA